MSSGSQFYTLFVEPPTLQLSPTGLPDGTVGIEYQQAVSATGGIPGYTYLISGGALPSGITFSTAGVLSGVPTAGGTFTFTVQATDSSLPIGAGVGTHTYTLTIAPPTMVLSPTALPDGQIGQTYAVAFSASGGTEPYTFMLLGVLPPGLSLSTDGKLTGTPTSSGTFSFSVNVTDSSTGTGPYSARRSFKVRVLSQVPPPPPNTGSPPTVVDHLGVTGLSDGSASLYRPDVNGTYSPAGVVSPFSAAASASRTVVADVDGDGVPDTVIVSGPGAPIRVAVVSGADESILVAPFDPFGDDFLGGGFVAAADFDGDGKAEFIVSPDQGGGARVSIYSLEGGRPVRRSNYFTVDAMFRGGARVAAGDLNGDGVPDLVVAAGFGGGPRVSLINGVNAITTDGFNPGDRLIGDFFAFESTLRNGVYLAVGDIDGDGFGDLLLGSGPGGGPRLLTLSGKSLLSQGAEAAIAQPLANFFVAGNETDRGGVRVATTDADRDGRADVATATGSGQPGRVRIYLGRNYGGNEPAQFQDLDPYPGASLDDGVFVG
jgi:hypothetical protein